MTAMNSCVWPWDSLHFTEQCEKPHPSNLQICLSFPPSPDINRDQVLLHNSTVKHCFVFFFFFLKTANVDILENYVTQINIIV